MATTHEIRWIAYCTGKMQGDPTEDYRGKPSSDPLAGEVEALCLEFHERLLAENMVFLFWRASTGDGMLTRVTRQETDLSPHPEYFTLVLPEEVLKALGFDPYGAARAGWHKAARERYLRMDYTPLKVSISEASSKPAPQSGVAAEHLRQLGARGVMPWTRELARAMEGYIAQVAQQAKRSTEVPTFATWWHDRGIPQNRFDIVLKAPSPVWTLEAAQQEAASLRQRLNAAVPEPVRSQAGVADWFTAVDMLAQDVCSLLSEVNSDPAEETRWNDRKKNLVNSASQIHDEIESFLKKEDVPTGVRRFDLKSISVDYKELEHKLRGTEPPVGASVAPVAPVAAYLPPTTSPIQSISDALDRAGKLKSRFRGAVPLAVRRMAGSIWQEADQFAERVYDRLCAGVEKRDRGEKNWKEEFDAARKDAGHLHRTIYDSLNRSDSGVDRASLTAVGEEYGDLATFLADYLKKGNDDKHPSDREQFVEDTSGSAKGGRSRGPGTRAAGKRTWVRIPEKGFLPLILIVVLLVVLAGWGLKHLPGRISGGGGPFQSPELIQKKAKLQAAIDADQKQIAGLNNQIGDLTYERSHPTVVPAKDQAAVQQKRAELQTAVNQHDQDAQAKQREIDQLSSQPTTDQDEVNRTHAAVLDLEGQETDLKTQIQQLDNNKPSGDAIQQAKDRLQVLHDNAVKRRQRRKEVDERIRERNSEKSTQEPDEVQKTNEKIKQLQDELTELDNTEKQEKIEASRLQATVDAASKGAGAGQRKALKRRLSALETRLEQARSAYQKAITPHVIPADPEQVRPLQNELQQAVQQRDRAQRQLQRLNRQGVATIRISDPDDKLADEIAQAQRQLAQVKQHHDQLQQQQNAIH